MFNVSESTNRTMGWCRTSEFACLVQTPQSYFHYLIKKHFMVVYVGLNLFSFFVFVCTWVLNSFMLVVPLISLYKHEFGVPLACEITMDLHSGSQRYFTTAERGDKRAEPLPLLVAITHTICPSCHLFRDALD